MLHSDTVLQDSQCFAISETIDDFGESCSWISPSFLPPFSFCSFLPIKTAPFSPPPFPRRRQYNLNSFLFHTRAPPLFSFLHPPHSCNKLQLPLLSVCPGVWQWGERRGGERENLDPVQRGRRLAVKGVMAEAGKRRLGNGLTRPRSLIPPFSSAICAFRTIQSMFLEGTDEGK